MADISKVPWEVGSILICSKCGAKFNQPNLSEEVKTEVRKVQKSEGTQGKIRVISTGCLGVCYPEKQTVAFLPINGPTEMYTTALEKEIVLEEVKKLISEKIKS
jgi:predicted metal-binding protein